MKIILKHIIRNIKEKKGRSVLIIISLMIASLVFTLNLTIPSKIVEETKNKEKNIIGYSDIVITKNNEFIDINNIKFENNNFVAVGVNQAEGRLDNKTITLYSTDINLAKKNKLVNTNILLKKNEIIINKSVANKFNVKKNDYVIININNSNYQFKVVEILENKGLFSFSTYGIVTTEETFDKIINTDNKYMAYYLDIKNNNTDSFIKYANDSNENYQIDSILNEDNIKEETSYVSIILKLIFVMSTIMIFFVINTLNKIVVMERMPVIGTFRSIGATKKKMNFILILENSMYGLIGGIIGSIIGLIVNNECIKLLSNIDTTSNISIEYVIFGIIFAITLEIIMSLGAIIKSNKYTIKETMFNKNSTRYKIEKLPSIISLVAILLSIILFCIDYDNNILLNLLKLILFYIGIAYLVPLIMLLISRIITKISKKLNLGVLQLAAKNTGKNKLIVSSSRLVIIATSLMLLIFTISSSFDKILDSFSYQFKDSDIFIRETNKDASAYKELKNIEGIKTVENIYMYSDDNITYNDNLKFDVSPIILGMNDSRVDIIENNYKIKNLKENEILVDDIYLKNNHLKVGDNITINMNNLKANFNYKIVGTINSFYYSLQREIIVINEKNFIKNYSTIPFEVNISIDRNKNVENIIKKIEKKLNDSNITVMTVNEFVIAQRKNINTILLLFYLIIGLSAILSFVGIINNQIISFMERKKELATLNSLCMSKKQINKMLVYESLITNISSCLIGLLISIMSIKLIQSFLYGIKMYMPVTFNYKIALIFIIIILISLLLTMIIPIRKIKKINIVETIKYE